MYAADVKGSIAFSKALLKAGILDEREQKEITRGLKEVEGEWQRGEVSQSSQNLKFDDLAFSFKEDNSGIIYSKRGYGKKIDLGEIS